MSRVGPLGGHLPLVSVPDTFIDSFKVRPFRDAAVIVVRNISVNFEIHGAAIEDLAECFNVLRDSIYVRFYVAVESVPEASLLQPLDPLSDKSQIGLIVAIRPAGVHVAIRQANLEGDIF